MIGNEHSIKRCCKYGFLHEMAKRIDELRSLTYNISLWVLC